MQSSKIRYSMFDDSKDLQSQVMAFISASQHEAKFFSEVLDEFDSQGRLRIAKHGILLC